MLSIIAKRLEETFDDIGFEALSRWYHPQLGQIPPDEFIVIAERIGIIKPLTEWVLKKLGVKLAIDDFGTGYSFFVPLKHMNWDIKLSRKVWKQKHN